MSSDAIIHVTDASFADDVLASNIPVLVDFWAAWCGPCKMIAPILDEVAGAYQGKLQVAKMNVDENANTPAQFGVRSIPYMVLVKDGKVVDSVVGAVPKAKLVDMINKAIG